MPLADDDKALRLTAIKGAEARGDTPMSQQEPRARKSGAEDARGGASAGAESSRRLLLLLLSFTEENHTQTVNDMATYLDTPVSTIYRYVGLLRDLGLLEEAERGRYRVSIRAYALARAARAASGGLAATIRPFLDQVAEETGETALLIRRFGHAVTAEDITESAQPVRLAAERGALLPLHSGAAARILLAALPPAQREIYYRSVRETQGLVAFPTDSELAQVASDGWTESFGQVEEGIWGMAAAIRDRRGVIAALAAAGPLYRLNDARRADVIAIVRRIAGEINHALEDFDPGDQAVTTRAAEENV